MSASLVSLFFGSFLASTVLPGRVEGLLYWLVNEGTHSFSELLITATIGNMLGGVLTFFMGRFLYKGLAHFSARPTPERKKTLLTRIAALFELKESSLVRVQKWGVPALNPYQT